MEMGFITHHYERVDVIDNVQHFFTEVLPLSKIAVRESLDDHHLVRMKVDILQYPVERAPWDLQNSRVPSCWAGRTCRDSRTNSEASGVRTEMGRPCECLFIAEPVVPKASTHRSIVFRLGIEPCRFTLNLRRKSRWTLMIELLFLKYSSTANARCSTLQLVISKMCLNTECIIHRKRWNSRLWTVLTRLWMEGWLIDYTAHIKLHVSLYHSTHLSAI